MTNAVAATPDAAVGAGIPFSVASRPQRRYSASYEVNNKNAGGSFPILQLAATGWVRRISMYIDASAEFASAADPGGIDGPWSLITGVTLTDATGQPVMQPISGYNLYLVNKYMPGSVNSNVLAPWGNPLMSPEYRYDGSATQMIARYRLDIDFEIDHRTGYGCIPNLDSNASLQLKVDFGPHTNAFAGVGVVESSISMRVETHYWAPISSAIGGIAVNSTPPGTGDYLETRYETQAISPNAENLVQFTNRGGLVKGVIMVTRDGAGRRVALDQTKNIGSLLDNQPIDEGITLASHYDTIRRAFGYPAGDAGVAADAYEIGYPFAGLDEGVVPLAFHAMSGGRDSWLNTRAGSLFQAKVTPGAGAGSLEVVTQIAQVKEAAAFYNVGVC